MDFCYDDTVHDTCHYIGNMIIEQPQVFLTRVCGVFLHKDIKNMEVFRYIKTFLNKRDREIAKPLDFEGKINYDIRCENKANKTCDPKM